MRKVLYCIISAIVSTVMLGVTAYAGEWLVVPDTPTDYWYHRDDMGNMEKVTDTFESTHYVPVGRYKSGSAFNISIFANGNGFTAWSQENGNYRYLTSLGNVGAVVDSSGYDTSIIKDEYGHGFGINGKEIAILGNAISTKRDQEALLDSKGMVINYVPVYSETGINDESTLIEYSSGVQRGTKGFDVILDIKQNGETVKDGLVIYDETGNTETLYDVYLTFGDYLAGEFSTLCVGVFIGSSESDFYLYEIYLLDPREYKTYLPAIGVS